MRNTVTVVGSINADLITAVPERPSSGKTVLATDLTRRFGGKGANQASAAARAGANTKLIAAVGDDAEATQQLEELMRDGVDVSAVQTIAGTHTGVAFISVTPEGENSIVVAAGANAELSSEFVLSALSAGRAPAVIVLQTEISAAVIEAVVTWATSKDVRIILNNGPFVPLSAGTLATADPLVMNEHEAREFCTGGNFAAESNLATAVAKKSGARSVVITMGAAEVQVSIGRQTSSIPIAPTSAVVDTTGAGDKFLGTLATGLASGSELRCAVGDATNAATESVGWSGARPPRHITSGPTD
jgi:ribokinase